jgi:hypothetical protein
MTNIFRTLFFLAALPLVTFPLMGEIRPEFFGFREGMTIAELKNAAKQYSMPEPCCAELDGFVRSFNGETNSWPTIVTLHPPQPIDPNYDIYNFYTTPPSNLYRGYNQELSIYYNPKFRVIGVGLTIARTDVIMVHQIIETVLNNVKKGYYGKCKISKQKEQMNIVSKYIYINILMSSIGAPQKDVDIKYGPMVFSLDCHFANFNKARDEFNKLDPLVIQ